jgi:hypothetical protein
VPARIAAAWKGNDAEALRVSGCESTGSPTSWKEDARNGQHLGVFQVATNVHAGRIRRLGFTPSDLLRVEPAVAVAWDIYVDAGRSWWDWRFSQHCWG